MQDYLGAVIVLTAAGASIWSLEYGLPSGGLVGLGLTYALTVSLLVVTCYGTYYFLNVGSQLDTCAGL